MYRLWAASAFFYTIDVSLWLFRWRARVFLPTRTRVGLFRGWAIGACIGKSN
jgi:hypothetical protein